MLVDSLVELACTRLLSFLYATIDNIPMCQVILSMVPGQQGLLFSWRRGDFHALLESDKSSTWVRVVQLDMQ